MGHKQLQLQISRLVALLLCVMLLVSAIPVVYAAEGTCGDSLTWSFDGATLTISGSGAMKNYSERDPAPWDGFRSEILQISFPEGMTYIGNRAFYGCTNLLSVAIPASVRDIGEAAFCKNSSLRILALQPGLVSIGRSAFEDCISLYDLRLPDTVTVLGNHAFYCCESLVSVSVPASVTSFGSGVFAYCLNLMYVDIGVSASRIPGWSFFGCEKLENLKIQGEKVSADAFKITSDPVLINPPELHPTEPGEDGSHDDPTEQPTDADAYHDIPNGTTVGSEIKHTENVTMETTVTINKDGDDISVKVDITATVVNPQGWKEILPQILEAEEANGATSESGSVLVTIYVQQGEEVPKDFLAQLTGHRVVLKVQTQSGKAYTVHCEQLGEQVESSVMLSYTIEKMEDVPEELVGYTVYKVKFNLTNQIPTDFVICLPGGHMRQTATMYAYKAEKIDVLQSVVVDDKGETSWHLENVSSENEYLIAIDVIGVDRNEVIIPPGLYEDYKIVDQVTGKEYEITGRKSSWGMELGQVMGIMAAVMVSVIVIVGVVIFIWNKKRIKRGYVPGLDDEE